MSGEDATVEEYCVDKYELFQLCIHDCNREWSNHRSYEKLQACVKKCVDKYL